MSARQPWWPYVKNVIHRYPEFKSEYEELFSIPASGIQCATENAASRQLPGVKQKYLDAVEKALEETKKQKDGELKLNVINMVLLKRSTTVYGAAMKCYFSVRTVESWHSDFIYLVAENLGLECI